jgi:hypothetical protein
MEETMTTPSVAGAHVSYGENRHQLTRGTLCAAVLGIGVAQVALAIPAVLQGLFQKDLGTTSSSRIWAPRPPS